MTFTHGDQDSAASEDSLGTAQGECPEESLPEDTGDVKILMAQSKFSGCPLAW